MYTEQLAVLLLIAATHINGPGAVTPPTLQMPRHDMEKMTRQTPVQLRPLHPGKQRNRIKQEREAMMLAQFY